MENTTKNIDQDIKSIEILINLVKDNSIVDMILDQAKDAERAINNIKTNLKICDD